MAELTSTFEDTLFIEETADNSADTLFLQHSPMKEEIIQQLEALVKEGISEEVFIKADELGTEYLKVCEQKNHELLDDFISNGGTAKDFEAPKDPFDSHFNELIHILNDRQRKFRKEKQEEVTAALQSKQQIVEELEKLVAEETNIGRAFQRFKELQNRWNEIGNVNSRDYKNIQSAYHRHVHNFYYNMKLSKDLKELDFKRNFEQRNALLTKIESLLQMESIRGVERLLKLYRMEWSELGPTAPETIDQLRTRYRELIGQVVQHIRNHYQEKQQEELEHLEQKKSLLEQIRDLSNQTYSTPKQWQSGSEKIEALLTEWKKIGYAPKDENDKVWEDLRAAISAFHTKKREYFGDLKKSHKANKEKKNELIARTKAVLEEDGSWDDRTKKIIQLQHQWKEAGHLDQAEENRLWKNFREVCDQFFAKKKEFFSERDAEQENNLRKKEELIKRLEEYQLTGSAEEDLKVLKEFSAEWKDIPHVPFKEKQRVYEQYKKVLDAKYDSMKLEAGQMHLLKFKTNVEMLAHSDHSDNMIRKERQHIKDRINRLQATLKQYENNMGFFANSKNKMGSLLKEVEDNMNKTKEELQLLQQKIKIINEVTTVHAEK